jgi:hypothetical protein
MFVINFDAATDLGREVGASSQRGKLPLSYLSVPNPNKMLEVLDDTKLPVGVRRIDPSKDPTPPHLTNLTVYT